MVRNKEQRDGFVMLKKHYKVIITCLMLAVIVFISSCDGTVKGNYIRTEDPISGNDELRINIKLDKIYGGSKNRFLDDISAKELADYINKYKDDNIDLSAEVFQDIYILIKKTDKNGNFVNHYMLHVRGMKRFFCPTARLKNDSKDFKIYMPFHVLVDASNRIQSDFPVNGIKFKTVGTKKDIYEFFCSYDRYDVEIIDDKFVVEDKVDNEKFEAAFSYEKRILDSNEYDLYVVFDIVD